MAHLMQKNPTQMLKIRYTNRVWWRNEHYYAQG